MNVTPTVIPDVLMLEPRVFGDARGHFFESFRQETFERIISGDVSSAGASPGASHTFVQDNQSRSIRHVLRGLHYQIRQPQGKLIRVVAGEVFDVAVDLRRSSPSFGKWVGMVLSAENTRQMWIPAGFAHGFLALSDVADVVYKATDYYAPAHERTLLWSDPQIGIDWPLTEAPILTAKDAAGTRLTEADLF
jgi:dTDP-4-dehydrorhamnose 3,5-epimerase